MIASNFYTDLRTGTQLTAGELHHSYTNLCPRDPNNKIQAFHRTFGSCHFKQEEFEMVDGSLREKKKPELSCSKSANEGTTAAVHQNYLTLKAFTLDQKEKNITKQILNQHTQEQLDC